MHSKHGLLSQHSNDEQIVPAHNMKKPIDFNTVNDDDYQPSVAGVSQGPAGTEISASQEELKLSNIPI